MFSPRSALALLLGSSLAILAACGGGGTPVGPPDATPYVLDVHPNGVFGEEEALLHVTGRDLVGLEGPIRVRLTARNGTPFLGGTQAVVEVPAEVLDDARIAFTLAATHVAAPVDVDLEVLHAGGVATGDALALHVEPQRLTSASLDTVQAGEVARVVLRGTGFHPLGRTAHVSFRAANGGFVGGGTPHQEASVLSETEIAVYTPEVLVLEAVTARLSVTLASGAVLEGGEAASLTFEPTPFVHGATPDAVHARERTPVRLGGYGFADGNDGKDRPQLLVSASEGTPFDGGTRAAIEVPFQIVDNGRIDMALPELDIQETVLAYVSFRRADGVLLTSEAPILRIEPQTIHSIAPASIGAADIGSALLVQGRGFLPGTGEAVLRVTATEGRPFHEGTASSVDIPLSLTGVQAATGPIPNLRVWERVTARVELLLPSGLRIPGDGHDLVFEAQYARFDDRDPVFLGDEAAHDVDAADFDGNGSTDLVFLHDEAGCIVQLNDGAGGFPKELREQVSGAGGLELYAFNADWQVAPDILVLGGGGGTVPPPPDLTSGDVATALEDGPPHFLWHNDGAAYFNWASSFTPTSPGQAAGSTLADVDGDGTLDVIIVYANGGKRCVELWRGDGGGGYSLFDRRTSSLVGIPEDLVSVAAGDLDGDGLVDLALLSSSLGVQIHRQTTRREFVFAASLSVSGGRTLGLADLDGDGDGDFVVATSTGVRIYERTSLSSFSYRQGRDISADLVNQVVLHDVDGDGDLDLALARGAGKGGERSTTILDNEGGLVFADSGYRSPPKVTRALVFADLDGDGAEDLVEANDDGKVGYLRAR